MFEALKKELATYREVAKTETDSARLLSWLEVITDKLVNYIEENDI